PNELITACEYAHSLKKNVYLAVNAFAKDADIEKLPELFRIADEAKVDALIVNDPGVIFSAKQIVPHIPLHLSTQANTLNSASALFWHSQGIERIITARELSLEQLSNMRNSIPSELELEIFVHGAMCISYSGRCLLSNYLCGRDSNKGECAQPCRWSFELRERGKDGEYFTIEQDGLGTHILNSRDLKLIEYLPEVINTGIASIKIEGRMKSVYYVAAVVNAYRMALDYYADCIKNGSDYQLPQEILNELEKVSHRPYTTGFAFGDPAEKGQMTHTSKYISDYDIVANVLDYNKVEKTALIRQRNRFFMGDTLEILSPKDINREIYVNNIVTEDGVSLDNAPHPNQILTINCELSVKNGDILRKARVSND
ncbi:MAG: U32 family peptidase, partial [Clostridiales bacterium]|nr:U32 family peptidase [Clostridiales bacterium]